MPVRKLQRQMLETQKNLTVALQNSAVVNNNGSVLKINSAKYVFIEHIENSGVFTVSSNGFDGDITGSILDDVIYISSLNSEFSKKMIVTNNLQAPARINDNNTITLDVQPNFGVICIEIKQLF